MTKRSRPMKHATPVDPVEEDVLVNRPAEPVADPEAAMDNALAKAVASHVEGDEFPDTSTDETKNWSVVELRTTLIRYMDTIIPRKMRNEGWTTVIGGVELRKYVYDHVAGQAWSNVIQTPAIRNMNPPQLLSTYTCLKALEENGEPYLRYLIRRSDGMRNIRK